jgi:hypothetical protein
MSAVHDFITKCLAECPEGADELLLAALIKKVQPKYGKDEPFEVFDEAGLCLGHFVPSFDDAILEQQFPEAMAALRRGDAGLPAEPGMSLEEFTALVDAEIEKNERQLAERGQPADRSA